MSPRGIKAKEGRKECLYSCAVSSMVYLSSTCQFAKISVTELDKTCEHAEMIPCLACESRHCCCQHGFDDLDYRQAVQHKVIMAASAGARTTTAARNASTHIIPTSLLRMVSQEHQCTFLREGRRASGGYISLINAKITYAISSLNIFCLSTTISSLFLLSR